MCLFVDTLRAYTVSAVVPSETLVIHKTKFRGVCKEFPCVEELYDSFRQSILTQGWRSLRCPLCKDLGHSEETCPKFSEAGTLPTDLERGGRRSSSPRKRVTMSHN